MTSFPRKIELFTTCFHLKIVCENGTYGQECNTTCGQCGGEEHCHHENGTCLNGCKPGYIGNLCKRGKETILSSNSIFATNLQINNQLKNCKQFNYIRMFCWLLW